jgi:hypothetical protein
MRTHGWMTQSHVSDEKMAARILRLGWCQCTTTLSPATSAFSLTLTPLSPHGANAQAIVPALLLSPPRQLFSLFNISISFSHYNNINNARKLFY